MSPSTVNHKTEKHTREYTELLSRLHLALKNIQLYPSGHNLLQAKLADAYQALAHILLRKRRLFLGVARDTFTYAGSHIGEGSTACTAFAKVLSRHEIASISFSKGISQHSLLLFLKTVGVLPEQRATGTNILQEISSLNITHLQVELIDYSYFAHNVHGDADSAPLTWLTFSQKLASGVLEHSDEHKVTGSRPKAIAPKTLAATINKQIGNHPQILQKFSSLLDQLLQQTPQQNATTSLGGQELSQIFSSLNPELREQFLKTTLRQCDKNIQTGNTEKILGEFSYSLVLDMLQQVNKEQATISPALLNLIHKLSDVHFEVKGQTPTSITRQRESLLRQKNYDRQVSPAYQNSLQNLSQHSSPPATVPPDFPLDEHLKSLEDTQLDRKIIQAMLIFMASPISDRKYYTLSQKLMELSHLLPDHGAFDLLQIIIRQLRKQTTNKTSIAKKAIAQKCIRDLAAPDFLDYIFAILPDSPADEKKNGIDFLLLLGLEALDSILKIYCMKTKVSGQDPMVMTLKTLRVETLTRVFTLLKQATPAHVLKLLHLIEYLGTQGTMQLLHPWLEHENKNIRDQVLNLLLPAQDQKAIGTLISMLESNDEPMVNIAIQFCDTHRPRACVPALIELLEYKLVTRAAVERNRQLIQVLGHIGDPSALPHLEGLAFGNWFFLRQEIADMKRLIFYSLKNYHPEASKRLLLKGNKTKDKKTVTICSTILHSHGRTNIKK